MTPQSRKTLKKMGLIDQHIPWKQFKQDLCAQLAQYLIPYYHIVCGEINKYNKEIEEGKHSSYVKPEKIPSFRVFARKLSHSNLNDFNYMLCQSLWETYWGSANVGEKIPWITIQTNGTKYNIAPEISAIARLYANAMAQK